MKKSFIITAVLLSVLGFSSCSRGFLDVNLSDQADLNDIFSQTETARRYLAHAYSFIPLEEDVTEGSGWVVARGGQALFSWYNEGKYSFFRSGNYSPALMADDPVTYYDIWAELYEGIRQCGIVIDNIDKDTVDSEATRAMLKAEAQFLRAYYYYCLFRQYGPVPKEGALQRMTTEECVDWIVSELDLAIPALATSMGAVAEGLEKWQGRATKGAAMALKARVLTMAASPLYNGADIYKGVMKNPEGKYLFPQEKDDSKWVAAAQACKDLLDLGMYSLCTSSGSGDDFKDAAAGYQKVFFEAWNSETIWGWWTRSSNEYCTSGYEDLGGQGAIVAKQLPEGFGKFAFAGVCPSLSLVDSYAMYESGRYPVTGYAADAAGNKLSEPVIDPASGYVADGWTENYVQKIDSDGAPAFKAHNSCVGREPRFYACIVPGGFYWPGTSTPFVAYDKSEGAFCRTGYAWRRNVPAGTILSTQSDYESLTAVYPEFRLAEIYLSYAEACNEQPQRDEAAALEYVNKVRARAGLNKMEEAYPEVIGNKDLLRTLIQYERRVEFAMEPLSYYDAVRWMKAQEWYPSANWTLKCSSSTYEGLYERVSDEHPGVPCVFTSRDYLYPISFTWMQQSPQMTQNYGF